MLKAIFISLVILGLAGVGSFILYGVAYSDGEAAGYGNGYSVGQEAGYSLGKQGGYDEGYNLGKEDGYDEGYETGYGEGVGAGLGHGYTLRNPTYREATTFLKQDKTDSNKYIEDTYVCSHFVRDVSNNAEEAGLRCAFVEIRYPDQGHSIIAFDTIDNGLVYFEAQTDEEVKPVVGKSYYTCVQPRPGYYYVKPAHDDTIMDILVIW